MILPKSFEQLVNTLTILPGVGEKTAERFVYSIYEKDIEEIENLANALIDFKKNIKVCEICGCLSDTEICNICDNKKRDNSTICVVEDSKNVFFIEKTGKYDGLYHVLNGLISPIDGKDPDDLNIMSLIDKRINSNIKEIIIALNPSIEGEVTSLYIQKLLEKYNIKVSRLSYGIPMGTDIEYLDPVMITKAWEDRKVIS
ncbi:recombination protein RecR [Clostridium sp. CAG:1000]|jgi:recombination protein RecR|nr:recombination mediator RecR [Clostridium sp.]CCX35605.1 recombination protein RecR [Clostridium sp. CAG:1000]